MSETQENMTNAASTCTCGCTPEQKAVGTGQPGRCGCGGPAVENAATEEQRGGGGCGCGCGGGPAGSAPVQELPMAGECGCGCG